MKKFRITSFNMKEEWVEFADNVSAVIHRNWPTYDAEYNIIKGRGSAWNRDNRENEFYFVEEIKEVK